MRRSGTRSSRGTSADSLEDDARNRDPPSPPRLRDGTRDAPALPWLVAVAPGEPLELAEPHAGRVGDRVRDPSVRRNTVTDFVTTSVASVLLVVPVFFTAFVFSKYLVSDWHLFPAGWDSWKARILPSFTLALGPIGYIARLIRAAVVETLQEDYVVAARARGLRQWRIMGVHVLRNSLAPFLSAAVPMLALVITGTLFVEQFFGIPGAASYFLDAVNTGDYPVLMGITVAIEIVVLAASLISDILLALTDPRLREAR